MRVTIEHREVATGVLGNHKDSYIDCTVNFSEEERAIIKARDLYKYGFSVRSSTALPAMTTVLGTNLMRFVGPFLIVGAFIWGLAGSGTPAGIVFFAGIGCVVYGWLRSRREDQRIDTDEQNITVKQLLNNPTFTVHGWNPASAKGLEQTIRENLAVLKNLIADSAQLKEKQTFEL